MQNYHIIKVKYLPATDYKGSRTKLTSERFNQSVTMGYDYSLNGSLEQAIDYLKANGHKVIGQGEGQNIAGYVICEAVENSFKELK